MSIKIKVSWDDHNVVSEGVRIYRSNTTFTPSNLPAVLATVPTLDEYEDLDVIEGQTYFYMLAAYLGEQEVFTECFEVKTDLTPTGIWALAVACWGTVTLPQFNKDLINEATWPENFSKTQDIISYVRAYNATGNITTPAVNNKVIDASILLGKRMFIQVVAGTFLGNYGRMYLEFMDASNNVLAAIIVNKANNNFGSTLQIGNTLANVVNVPSIGTYPTANGYLDILPTGIKYTPVNPAATTRFNEYLFSKDLTSLAKLRISQLAAYQPHNTGSTGSPTGSSAHVYLKLLP